MAAARESAAEPFGQTVSRALTSTATDAEWLAAQERANICEQFLRLMATGEHSLRAAAAECGKSGSWFSGANSPLERYKRGGVAALVQSPKSNVQCLGDLSKAIEALGWFIPAAGYFYSRTNLTQDRGSVPEAVRRTLSLPQIPAGWKITDLREFLAAVNGVKKVELPDKMDLLRPLIPICPNDVRETCLARQHDGLELVPKRIAREIPISGPAMRYRRNPREAELRHLSAFGHNRLTADFSVPGGARLLEAGELAESDDGTPNIPLWIPWHRFYDDANKCLKNFQVLLSRFQILPIIDAGTGFLAHATVTARPRGSYRAEDIGSTLHGVGRAHGIFRAFRLERGSWESKLVKNIISGMGSRLITVHSPHQKAFIERFFGILWTKLSVHFAGDVGRFRGENREASLLFTECQQGRKDPRKYFPSLEIFMAAIEAAIAEYNQTPLETGMHGRWVPAQRWHEEARRHLGQYHPETAWLYAPIIRENKIQNTGFKCSVRMIDGQPSVPFHFQSPELPAFSGALARAHFDPLHPDCTAKLVLAVPFNGLKPGTVIGDARETGTAASYTQFVLGYRASADSHGVAVRQATHAALKREARSFGADGKIIAAESETRDGLGNVIRAETGSGLAAPGSGPESRPAPGTSRRAPHDRFTPPSAEESEKRNANIARQADRARRLQEFV